MEIIGEGPARIPIADAAAALQTTPLRVLMLLKHKVLIGCQVDGEWFIEESSLECLKAHGMDSLEQAGCRSHCTAASCGCTGR